MKNLIFIIAVLMMPLWTASQSSDPAANEQLTKGKQYSEQGKINKAKDAYAMAIRKDPNCAEAYMNLGVLYYKTNAYKLSKQMLQKAIDLDSTLIEARQNLGVLYYAAGQPEQAVKIWRAALSRDQKYSGRARLHLFIGVAYLFSPEIVRLDDFVRVALNEFDKALQADSNFAEAYYWRGKAMELQGDINGAMIEYMKATQIDDCYAEAWNQWGLLLYTRGNYVLAWEKLNKAIFCDPANANYHYNMGLNYLARNMRFDAETEFSKAYKLNPNIGRDTGR